MKKIVLICASFLCIFAACKKDSTSSGTGSTVLSGTWQFMGMTAHTQSGATYFNGGDTFEDVTTSDFTTGSNGGTISFSGGTATSTAITYSVSTTAFDSSYEDGVLIDTFSAPFSATVPPSSSASAFKIIGSDSVYFASGLVSSSALTGGSSQSSPPGGFRFSISGDILTMISPTFVMDTTENLSGVSTFIVDGVNYTLTLKKQ